MFQLTHRLVHLKVATRQYINVDDDLAKPSRCAWTTSETFIPLLRPFEGGGISVSKNAKVLTTSLKCSRGVRGRDGGCETGREGGLLMIDMESRKLYSKGKKIEEERKDGVDDVLSSY